MYINGYISGFRIVIISTIRTTTLLFAILYKITVVSKKRTG
jgi:hypothetical protein